MSKGCICNFCGEQLDMFDKEQDFSIRKHIGYGSTHDGEHIEMTLCCRCVDLLIDTCVVSPIAENAQQ